MLSILGDEIKKARNLQRFSQEDLAERIGVTRQAIINWEKGKAVPDMLTAVKLAEALDVTVEELASTKKVKGPAFYGPDEKRFLGTVTIGKDGNVKLPKEFLREMKVFPGDKMLMLADTERGVEFLPMDILWKNSMEKHWADFWEEINISSANKRQS